MTRSLGTRAFIYRGNIYCTKSSDLTT